MAAEIDEIEVIVYKLNKICSSFACFRDNRNQFVSPLNTRNSFTVCNGVSSTKKRDSGKKKAANDSAGIETPAW